MFKVSESLAPAESKNLLECVLQHHEVFAIESNEQGEVVGVEHEINTGDSPPFPQVPHQVPFAVRREMKLVQEMLRDEVI